MPADCDLPPFMNKPPFASLSTPRVTFPLSTASGWRRVAKYICGGCGEPAYEHKSLPGNLGCLYCQYIAIPENVAFRFKRRDQMITQKEATAHENA